MSAEELKEYSSEDLEVELKRREKIKNSVWPKKFTISAEYYLDDDDSFTNFLEEDCGFMEESKERDTATDILSDVSFELEVKRDGKTRITKVNGHDVIQLILETK